MSKIQHKLVAGNWKMNGSYQQACELADAVSRHSLSVGGVETLLCPPALHLQAVINIVAAVQDQNPYLKVGAQDCHFETSGAFTGNIAASMIKDIGCEYVIVGHSERRDQHNENDQMVQAKARAAIESGLKPIICVGEHLESREAGKHVDVVLSQLVHSLPDNATTLNLSVAYEPVWAIGTGKTAGLEDVREMHSAIYAKLNAHFGANAECIRILYGGSVKADNAADIMKQAHVGGVLVGGASLKAQDFAAIISAAQF